uniref:Uncharacterized protein n=1 Tax=uncultured Desulfobacterales bacterium HF0200_07G10 TaxID=710741 RepID=E0XU44_9BACT|nr:hypothetical protein [uncultured Desulfobacterales bacterium HF0200_07G10]
MHKIACGGRALDGLGASPGYQTQPIFEFHMWYCRSQTLGDKVQGRKGKSPDHQLRSQSHAKWERLWEYTDNQEVGLEAAIL